MNSDNETRTLAARTVHAFRPVQHDETTGTTEAHIELLRRGPAVRAGEPAGDTRWEVHVTVTGEPAVTSSAETTWDALLEARKTLESHGWRLAITGARTDHNVLDPDRQRESTTVSHLTEAGRGGQPGIFRDADPATVGTVEDQERHRAAWIERRYGPAASAESIRPTTAPQAGLSQA